MISLPAPQRAFASDNAAGVHPAVMAALQEANVGHALADGSDRWTAEFEDRMRDLFGAAVEPLRRALNTDATSLMRRS